MTSPISREVALRIGLAARALTGIEPRALAAALADRACVAADAAGTAAAIAAITAAVAASASLKVSLTRRGIARNVVLVTPRVGETQRASDWIASATAASTEAPARKGAAPWRSISAPIRLASRPEIRSAQE